MINQGKKNRIILVLSVFLSFSCLTSIAGSISENLPNAGNAVSVPATAAKPQIQTKVLLSKSETDSIKAVPASVKVAYAAARPLNVDLKLNKVALNKPAKKSEISSKVFYKLVNDKSGKNKIAVVYLNNKEIARYLTSSCGYSAENRAKIMVNRLNKTFAAKVNSTKIMPGIENGTAVGRYGTEILFSADKQNANAQGLSPSGLAIVWVNNIRTALGAQKLNRDNSLVPSRGMISTAFVSKYLGREEVGIASWYGGRFHGRRAEDGSVFNKHECTAAHKTLPFGSLVKVTNLGNGKYCIVRITDRGPYAPGRVIDLSREAARQTGILSSGISKVKLEVVGKS